jgi:superfamily II DNA or RNA helicase
MKNCVPDLQVCLLADPSRMGFTTGKVRISGSVERWQVRFLDGQADYVLCRSLRILDGENSRPPDVYEILEAMAFTNFDRLRLELTHHRLSGRLANLIYSLDATNTDFYPHQYKPVLAMINSPTKGILIGDEVGLGKTIEAGLIWTELRSRYQYNRILVVCKAFLKPKWAAEFKQKFGISLEETNPTHLYDSLDKNKPRDGFALVASYDGLRPPKGWRGNDADEQTPKRSNPAVRLARFLEDQEGEDLFDLVVFDECQYMRNDTTGNHQLGRLLTKTAGHVAMLSATPVNNSTNDLFNLFNLLDESLFPYQSQFPRLVEQNAPIVRLRDDLISGALVEREQVERALNSVMSRSLFDSNEQLSHLLDSLPDTAELRQPQVRARLAADLEKVNLFGKIFTRTRKRDIDGKRPKREAVSFGVEMTVTEASIYSAVTQTIQAYADRNELTTGFLFNMPQQQMCSSFAAAVYWWRHQKEIDVTGDLAELAGGSLAQELSTDDDAGARPLFHEICGAVDRLGDLTDVQVNDSKYLKLKAALDEYRTLNPGKKILLFSFFKQTIRYLQSKLQRDGYGVEILYGGLDKEAALETFRTNERIDILLASEVAAEGVDLQFASLVINYDLPWNPMRVEQRIGRIDRLGQLEPKIHIWNFYYKDSIDDRVYMRLYTKLEIFKNALGGLEEIIGPQIDKLTNQYLTHGMSDVELSTQFDAIERALETVRTLEKDLDNSASQLVAHGDFIRQAINEAREFGRFVRVEDLVSYVEDFFVSRYPGVTMHCVDPSRHAFRIDLTSSAISEIQEYWERERIFQPTKLTSPILLPKTLFVFSSKIGQAALGTEIITQFHPITRFIASKIDADPAKQMQKTVVAVAVDTVGRFRQGHYLFCCRRFGFSSGRQAIERLAFQAFSFPERCLLIEGQAELLIGLAVSNGRQHAQHNSLNGAELAEIFGSLLESDLDAQFERERSRLQRAINDRVSVQLTSLETYRLTEEHKHGERIAQAVVEKRSAYAKSQETRLKNLLAKLDVKRESIERSKDLRGSPDFVAAGVVTVTG